jgi:pimeloyl-[acyl-carrier protein] methyl ester esterase
MHLLLLPGLDGSGDLFDPLVRALPSSITAHVVRYPADRPLNYHDLFPLVTQAAVDIDGDFIVLGESFSGPLSLMLAAQSPPHLRGVILCATFIRFPLAAWMTRLRWMVGRWMFRSRFHRTAAFIALGRLYDTDTRHLLKAALDQVTPDTMAARIHALMDVDVSDELRACPVPVVYLRATRDRLIRRSCSRLIRSIRPDIEVIDITAPHLLLQTAPDECAAAIYSFSAAMLLMR